jgi:hypothetical protein
MRVAPEELHSGCIAPIPGVLVMYGSNHWVPIKLPGFQYNTVDLKRHPEPVSFLTRDPIPSGSVVLHSPGTDIPVFSVQPGEYDLFIVSGSLAA